MTRKDFHIEFFVTKGYFHPFSNFLNSEKQNLVLIIDLVLNRLST